MSLKIIPLQKKKKKKKAVEIVIDNEHQTPVKSYFSSVRLGAVCAAGWIYQGGSGTGVALVVNLVLLINVQELICLLLQLERLWPCNN